MMRIIRRIALKEDINVIETTKGAHVIFFAYSAGFPYAWIDETEDFYDLELQYRILSGPVGQYELDPWWQHAGSTMTEGGRVYHLYIKYPQA